MLRRRLSGFNNPARVFASVIDRASRSGAKKCFVEDDDSAFGRAHRARGIDADSPESSLGLAPYMEDMVRATIAAA
jgi:hypothetical protein